MKTFVGLFGISALFGLAILVAYFFVAHEESTGTALLALMTAALTFTAGYAIVAERDARLECDRPNATPEAVAGEVLGTFTKNSPYPISIAVLSLGTLAGVIWSPVLAVVCFAGIGLCLWRMGAESART